LHEARSEEREELKIWIYSSTDEALLRPHTNLGVQDAVRALQQYVIQHINNQVRDYRALSRVALANPNWFSKQTQCTLSLFNITDENIILSVRLPFDQKLSTMEMLRKEKVNWARMMNSPARLFIHVM
jgi:hypothetical protein